MDNHNRSTTTGQPDWLSKFVTTYQQLSTDNLTLLEDIYAESVEFQDPMHFVSGLSNLQSYFHNLYTNLKECRFEITDVIFNEREAAIYWVMNYRHPKLNNGKTVTVEGHSRLKGHDGRVHYHRDYLDLGAMLYEQIPVIGAFVKQVKRRASK
ncbi:nuclear transport factor 2 family protein [Reinekea marinisedimentorum]|uniref:SnoaL-like protein n=1 Tax=Reinekea marinisedimentorum TaxID=230495 RepID=A0A4R3HWY7_9GAMM|nr:nuclear transport factor 2 family protein [Reinekea marinisedimentorum]TCS37113.1 SnoaL-like protein [Reinekea marinisedimentorum]